MPVSCLAYCRDRDLEWLSPGAMWRGGAVSKLKMRYQSACRRGMSGWSQPLCGAGGGGSPHVGGACVGKGQGCGRRWVWGGRRGRRGRCCSRPHTLPGKDVGRLGVEFPTPGMRLGIGPAVGREAGKLGVQTRRGRVGKCGLALSRGGLGGGPLDMTWMAVAARTPRELGVRSSREETGSAWTRDRVCPVPTEACTGSTAVLSLRRVARQGQVGRSI